MIQLDDLDEIAKKDESSKQQELLEQIHQQKARSRGLLTNLGVSVVDKDDLLLKKAQSTKSNAALNQNQSKALQRLLKEQKEEEHDLGKATNFHKYLKEDLKRRQDQSLPDHLKKNVSIAPSERQDSFGQSRPSK